jgi:CDP-diacylglycerol---glycerol-3-phosphate 3-phosphatidyltransferase
MPASGRVNVPPMNWANVVTFGRIALVPVFVYLMYADARGTAAGATRVGPWLAIVVFAIASLTDSLDGYLARRNNQVTRLGTFMDPLADKLLVGAALVVLVALRGFPAWAAAIIVVREIAVSLLRSAALRRGRSMPASRFGKLKTATQLPMVVLWLFPRSGWVAGVQDVAVVIAVVFTILSGAQYFLRAGELLAPREVRPSR